MKYKSCLNSELKRLRDEKIFQTLVCRSWSFQFKQILYRIFFVIRIYGNPKKLGVQNLSHLKIPPFGKLFPDAAVSRISKTNLTSGLINRQFSVNFRYRNVQQKYFPWTTNQWTNEHGILISTFEPKTRHFLLVFFQELYFTPSSALLSIKRLTFYFPKIVFSISD